MEPNIQSAHLKKRIWIYLSIFITMVLVVTGFLYYTVEKHRIRLEKYDGIVSVANLKLNQIENWRSERLEDARIFSRSSFTIKAILNMLKEPGNMEIRSAVRNRLALECSPETYSEAFLLDSTGRTLVSADGSTTIDSSERNLSHDDS